LLAENVPGVIYLCRDDENFTNIFISANIEKITGYPPADFLNGTTDVVQLIHPDDRDAVDQLFRAPYATGQASHSSTGSSTDRAKSAG